MVLRIATAQKKVQLVKDVFVPALESITGLKYQFEPITDHVPAVEAGDVLLMCGGFGVELMQDEGLVPKNRTVNSLREKPVKSPAGGDILITYDPGITQKEANKIVLCRWDVRLAARLDMTGSLDPELGEYKYTDTFQTTIDRVNAHHSKGNAQPLPLSLDLECIGLDPHRLPSKTHPGARIVSISFTYAPGQADVYYVPETGADPEVLEQIKWLCQTPRVKMIGANLKFDILWIKKHWGFWVTNQKFDTTLVGSMLDENTSNSLNIHAKMYTPMGGYDDGFNRKHNKSRMDLAYEYSPEEFLTYAGGDTDAVMRTYDVLKRQLVNDERMANLYMKLVQPASDVFAKLEHRGVVVDRPRYLELKEEVQTKERELHQKALKMLPRKLRLKYHADLKLTRPVILREFLFTGRGLGLDPIMFTAGGKEGKGPKLPSTSGDHLAELLYQNPNEDLEAFAGIMKEWGSTKKTLSTYITGFMKHIRSDGKFHPSYMLFRGAYGDKDVESGARTGRLSCKDPAWQTLVKHTIWANALRTVYPCPKGMAILKLDFSQGELRVTACVANESTMLGVYQQGLDLHLKTGAMVSGYEFEEAMAMWEKAATDPEVRKLVKTIRQGGKAGNFGLIYAMGAEGFQIYAQTTYGVHWPMEKCERVRNQFFATYPGLIAWHKQYKEIARLHGHVRSPLGRIRHLPLINSSFQDVRAAAQRQAINAPIQSTLSDMMLLAMIEIDKRYPDLWMAGMVHDDLMVYVPQDEVDTWAHRLKDVMENLPLHEFGWYPQLTFPVDAEASVTNLAECKGLKL